MRYSFLRVVQPLETTIPSFRPSTTPTKALQGFRIQNSQKTKTKTIIFCEDPCCLHRSSSPTEPEVPRLNTPALFSFGGEAHLEMFPLFIDNSANNSCCFFVDLRRNDTYKSEMDRVIVFLQMILDQNWPLAVNQITKRKTNHKLTFAMSSKLPIRTKERGRFHFLKMLKQGLLN